MYNIKHQQLVLGVTLSLKIFQMHQVIVFHYQKEAGDTSSTAEKQSTLMFAV